MRSLYAVGLLLVAACGSASIVAVDPPGEPDASAPDAGRDVTAPDAAEASATDAETDAGPLPVDAAGLDPACNGAARLADCRTDGLQSAYGVELACAGVPYLLVDGGALLRPAGRDGCLEWRNLDAGTDVICCPD